MDNNKNTFDFGIIQLFSPTMTTLKLHIIVCLFHFINFTSDNLFGTFERVFQSLFLSSPAGNPKPF